MNSYPIKTQKRKPTESWIQARPSFISILPLSMRRYPIPNMNRGTKADVCKFTFSNSLSLNCSPWATRCYFILVVRVGTTFQRLGVSFPSKSLLGLFLRSILDVLQSGYHDFPLIRPDFSYFRVIKLLMCIHSFSVLTACSPLRNVF